VVVAAAARRGFSGPCGVDAFVFRGPEGAAILRPVVELNARYTVGTVVIGLLKRHREQIAAGLGLDSGERARFAFGLAPPDGGWPEIARSDVMRLPLAAPDAGLFAFREGALPELAGPEPG
jgi:hypothetical protein